MLGRVGSWIKPSMAPVKPESNAVTSFTATNEAGSGNIVLAWSLQVSARRAVISVSPALPSFPVTIAADSGTTSFTITGVRPDSDATYTFTMQVYDRKDRKVTATSTATVTVVGSVFEYDFGALVTNFRALFMSRNGRYVCCDVGAGLRISSDKGRTFPSAPSSSLLSFVANSAYTGCISDDGLYVVAYQYNTAGKYYHSQNTGVNWSYYSIAANQFNLVDMCMSATGNYLYASGDKNTASGSTGGFFRATNQRAGVAPSFTRISAATLTNVIGCNCSSSGKVVAIDCNGGAGYLSLDYGATLKLTTRTLPTGKTTYGRRTVAGEKYVAYRSIGDAAFSFSVTSGDLTDSSATLTTTFADPSGDYTQLINIGGDAFQRLALDDNVFPPRIYFMGNVGNQVRRLYYADSTFATTTAVTIGTSGNKTFSQDVLSITSDGKTVAGFDGTKVRFVLV